jgi:hypothetical protein
MSSGMNHGSDEEFAWKAALGIMLFFSFSTVVLWVLGLFPFQPVFAFALIGIPTLVLFVGWLVDRLKGRPKEG